MCSALRAYDERLIVERKVGEYDRAWAPPIHPVSSAPACNWKSDHALFVSSGVAFMTVVGRECTIVCAQVRAPSPSCLGSLRLGDTSLAGYCGYKKLRRAHLACAQVVGNSGLWRYSTIDYIEIIA